MKRAIVILTAALLIFVLWGKFSAKKVATNDAANRTTSNTNSVRSRSLVHGGRHAGRPSDDSTNASAPDTGETGEKKLSREQVEAYLLKTKRSAESLLNAFAETGDTNFLAEAVKNHSDNPLVQWTMLNQEISPEERAQWLAKLKVSSPDNALPNYLSALDDLKAGNTVQALAEMDSASKKKLSSYEQERAQSREEMYLLSGFSPLEAKEKGDHGGFSDLAQMKQLSQQVSELQQKYKATGDNNSNQQLAALGVEIGRKYSDPNTPYLINDLVGQTIEKNALRNLDSETYYDFLGKTAGERIQEMKEQKQEIYDLAKTFPQTYSSLSDAEKMIYLNRRMLYGELNAWRWLKQNYGGETK